MPEIKMTPQRLATIGGYIEDFPADALADSPLGLIVGLYAEAVRLRAVIAQAVTGLACDCHEAYTQRGRCEPNAKCYVGESLREALG